MQVAMFKSFGGLKPLDTEDEEKMKTLPKDWEGLVTLKHPRNYRFHKKYFALINLGFENQEAYNNVDHFRKIMQMKAGFYDICRTDKGIVPLPKSISFGSMEEGQFSEVYGKVLEQVADHLGLGTDDLSEEVEKKLNGFY
tara:strand:+ start:643 stop:1062 length:420 start_codon:yes stop_codon:yes gene_type:complete